jgi:tRNA threonylcarbamoyladenosine biosynthesis protein TsaE
VDLIFTLEQINTAAKQFLQIAADTKVFAFHGEMGTGKTTFIHALCDAKGVKDAVGSPTFSIINEYAYVPVTIGSDGTKRHLFHIDLYRLKDEAEAVQAGVEDCLYSGHICFVEWPDRAAGIIPAGTMHVYITVNDSQTRCLTIRDK